VSARLIRSSYFPVILLPVFFSQLSVRVSSHKHIYPLNEKVRKLALKL